MMAKLLELMWEQGTIGLGVLDGQGCWCRVNPAFEQLCGWPGAEILGKPWTQVFSQLVFEVTDPSKTTSSLRSGLWQIVQHNQEIVHREITVIPLCTDNGESIQMVSVTTADIYNPLRDQARLSALAAEVGVTLGQSLSLSQSLEGCTTALVKHLEATFAGIWLLNETTRLLELQAYSGDRPTEAEFGGRIPLGISIIGFIAQNRQPYVTGESIQALQDHPTAEASETPGQAGKVVAFAGYPLMMEGRLIGVIAVCSGRRITKGGRETLSWVANAVSVAIDRVKAREELLTRRETLLFRLASQIRRTLDLETILDVAVHEIQELLQVHWCWFMWYRPSSNATQDAKSLALSRWEVVKEAKHPHVSSLIGCYSVAQAKPEWVPLLCQVVQRLLNLEVIRIDATHQRDPIFLNLLEASGFAGILALPIRTDAGAVGVIGCGISRTEQANLTRPNQLWADSEVELIKAVADQLAIAITQAELCSELRKSAETAQNQALKLSDALQQLQSTQAQLIQTEKISSLGQLVAGIAHEINNPINFISGNLAYATDSIQELLTLLNLYQTYYPRPVQPIQTTIESLDLQFIQKDLPQLIESMQLGVDRINEIIKSLRNFSRSDQKKKELFNIHEGIDNTLLILRHRIQNSDGNITIIKHYGDIPPIQCYIGQINQVFMNIISNAIDALETQPPPRIITIHTSVISKDPESTSPLSSNPHALVIRIQDNGPGIQPASQEHLFDSFFTTKPMGKGTGLGLSISRQIVVEKHQGVLKCFSQPGQGTEFWIQLPMNETQAGS